MMTPSPTHEERSIGELVGQLANETTTLVHQEVLLAKTEMTEKAKYAAKQTVVIAVGSMIGQASLLFLLGAIALLLAGVMPIWVSALLVSIAASAISYVVIQKGLAAFKHIEVAPVQTLKTLEENKLWAQKQVR